MSSTVQESSYGNLPSAKERLMIAGPEYSSFHRRNPHADSRHAGHTYLLSFQKFTVPGFGMKIILSGVFLSGGNQNLISCLNADSYRCVLISILLKWKSRNKAVF